jgi:RHS repeat-associated protein
MVAIVSRRSDGSNTTRYILQDHLGSVASILSSTGASIVSESFDAFGARRDADAWAGPCPCGTLSQIAAISRRGYTGHEMIGGHSMGLIHMNGRVQDAVIGRFLSPDPIVQFPFFSQSFNRYSYVLNNPLTFTDPSGFKVPEGMPRFPLPSIPNAPDSPYCAGGWCEPPILREPGEGRGSSKSGPVPRDTPGPSVLGFSPNRDGTGRDGAERRDLMDWICGVVGIVACHDRDLFEVKGQSERWIGGPFDGAEPPERIPGGPWKWQRDQRNSRGGKYRHPKGRSANWDPDGHWDVDDGKGGPRQRYDRWGNPTSNHKPPKPNTRLQRPIARLGRRALRALGPIGWVIWLDQVASDPSILREDNLCTAGNCTAVEDKLDDDKSTEK